MDSGAWHLKELEKHTDEKLDGVLSFLLNHDYIVSSIIMDIIPIIQSLHNDYCPDKHSDIIYLLKSNASPKEITITILQQLEYKPCYYSLPLLLPLLTIQNNKSCNDILVNLQETLEAGYFCSDCLKEAPGFVVSNYHNNILISILGEFNHLILASKNFSSIYNIIDHIIAENLVLFQDKPELEREFNALLDRYEISFANLINSEFHKDKDLIPKAYIISHSFSNLMYLPLVYQPSYLFSRILPWISAILECCHAEYGEPKNSTSLLLGLNSLKYMVKQTYTITHKQHKSIAKIFRCLVSNAINNRDVTVRKDAASLLTRFLTKTSNKEKLMLIEEFYNHENGSVSGIFIDACRSVLHLTPKIDVQLKKVISLIINNSISDVMMECDRVHATLSLINNLKQYDLPFCEGDSIAYISKVSSNVSKMYGELQRELHSVNAKPQSGRPEIPATLNVDGEVLTELPPAEKVESIKLAQCRLDLISYSLARCREIWNL